MTFVPFLPPYRVGTTLNHCQQNVVRDLMVMGRPVEENHHYRELTKVISEARSRKLIRRDERWNFVVEDFDAPNFVVKDDIGAGRRQPDMKVH